MHYNNVMPQQNKIQDSEKYHLVLWKFLWRGLYTSSINP